MTHCLAGIYKPTAGEAIVKSDGKYIDLFKETQVSKYISVVPQHDIFWPNMSISEHLDLIRMFNSLQHPVKNDLILKAL